MISQILKAAAAAAIAVTLILAVIKFWGKIKNQTKSKTKSDFKKLKPFRVSAFVFAVVICFVFALASYFDTAKQATAVIGLNYAEASLGQNANGTRYNMSDIICDDVINRMIKKGGYDDLSASDVKSCLSVTPVTQGNSYSKTGYHISTEFSVYYSANKKTQKYDSQTLVQLLCNSYRDYYFDKYVNDFQIQFDDLAEETKNLDYLDAADLLTKKANKILNYLYGLQNKSSSFISSNGSTFASMAAKVDTLNSVQIYNSLYSFILQQGISSDTDRLLKRFNFINSQSGFNKQEKDQSYKITKKAIAKYDKDMARIVLVPTWDNDGQYYMGRTKIGIDTLSVQAVDYSNSIADIEKELKNNNLKLEKFKSAKGNTAANKKYVAELMKSTEQSLEKLADEARLIGQEYYSKQMNQCISSKVYSNSVFSNFKSLLAVFLIAYVVYWAKRSSESFAAEVDE